MKKISEDVGKLDKGDKGTVMEADFAESKMQSFQVTVNDKLDGNLDKHGLNSMGILTPLVGLNEIGKGFGSRSAERVVGRRLDGNGYGRGGSGGGPGNSRYRKQDMPCFEGVNLNGQRSRNYKFRLAKDEIAGNGKEISHTPLTLVVKKNSVPDLTMIDLPCNTMILVHGQPEDIYKQILDITVEFISTGESIILNVFFTTVEFPICESIRMSQLVDKTGERTLAAVTKPDKDPDWLHENVITDDGKIGLGYACVRNRIGVHWLCLCEEDSSHKFVEEFLVAEIEVLEETKAIALPECLPRLAFQALLQLNLTLQFPSFNLEDKVVFGGGVM